MHLEIKPEMDILELSVFKNFFKDETVDDITKLKSYSIARELTDPFLPSNMTSKPKLTHYLEDGSPVSDRKFLVEKFINEDEDIKEEFLKSLKDDEPLVKIKNYILDFKPYLVYNKLMYILNNIKRDDENKIKRDDNNNILIDQKNKFDNHF